MAIPDFEKPTYANEEGKACVDGSAAADEILEDRRGGCSTTRIVELQAIYDGREGECEGYCCCEILHVDAFPVFPRRFIPRVSFPSKRVMKDCERHCISIYSKPSPPT